MLELTDVSCLEKSEHYHNTDAAMCMPNGVSEGQVCCCGGLLTGI